MTETVLLTCSWLVDLSSLAIIEGDISACFDEIDHRILEAIMRERIADERFIRLINKMLRAGYFDMQHEYHRTNSGAPQGGLC